MMIDGLSLDGNVIEYALIAAIFALLIAMFLVGRFSGLRYIGNEQRSIDALKQIRAEEEMRVDELRKEKGEVFKKGLRAEDALDRWDMVKRDHRALDEMRRELDEFEREESNRIDQIELKRAEAARRLSEIQTALDGYPAEIIGDDNNWNELIEKRKEEYDQLQQELEDANKELAEARDRLKQERPQAEKLEQTKMQLENEIKSTHEEIDRLKTEVLAKREAVEAVNNATIEFANDIVNVAVKEISHGDEPDDDKLSAFRIIPDCLRLYDDEHPIIDEDDLLDEFQNILERLGLHYPRQIIWAFHTALKVNDLSPLTVLSGLSGTGKSQLPRAYARFFGIHFLHVPVEPGWDSPQDLLGFYDFVSGRYRPTDRARALGHFDSQFSTEIGIEDDRNWKERMLIILLDEMNLARTEYYFSEFLSRLEMRGLRANVAGDADHREDAQIAIDLPYAEGERPKHLYVPHNVLWVGTLNEDETTQALSDKVLDRANSIRFAPPGPDTLRAHNIAPEQSIRLAEGYLPYKRWLQWSDRDEAAVETNAQEIDDTLYTLAELMQKAGRGFGYRIAQSIKAYIRRYPGQSWKDPMIDQINMRLLPKLSGSEMNSDCQDTLRGLRELSEQTLGNPEFAQALQNAENTSEVNRIFTWPGYTYE